MLSVYMMSIYGLMCLCVYVCKYVRSLDIEYNAKQNKDRLTRQEDQNLKNKRSTPANITTGKYDCSIKSGNTHGSVLL